MPTDLVDRALKQARMELKWFPKPAELRGFIEGALADRRRHLSGVRKSASEWEQSKSTVTPDERKKVGEMLGVLGRALGGDLEARARLENWDPSEPKPLYPAV